MATNLDLSRNRGQSVAFPLLKRRILIFRLNADIPGHFHPSHPAIVGMTCKSGGNVPFQESPLVPLFAKGGNFQFSGQVRTFPGVFARSRPVIVEMAAGPLQGHVHYTWAQMDSRFRENDGWGEGPVQPSMLRRQPTILHHEQAVRYRQLSAVTFPTRTSPCPGSSRAGRRSDRRERCCRRPVSPAYRPWGAGRGNWAG